MPLIRLSDPQIENIAPYDNPLSVAGVLKPESPVQCFSQRQLTENANAFLNEFGADTAYAVKANPGTLVLKAAHAAGIRTFDVASLEEVRLISGLFDDAELHYHNPVKSRTEIASAYHQYGCKRFAIDDFSELTRIRKICGNDSAVEIAVRFRLPTQKGAIHDFSSKFGTTPQSAARLLSQVKLCSYKPVLTFHPGSQCTDAGLWALHIKTAARIVKNSRIKLHKLNIGGGFPASYARSQPAPLTAMFKTIRHTAAKHFPNHTNNLLECEPGRAIVASSISTLARVKMVRKTTRELFLNDGIYGGLLEMAQAPALTPHIRNIRKGRYRATTDCQPFTVYGPTCDPLDRLPGTLALPVDIAEGDYVQFCNLGAYGGATSTRFNGYGTGDMILVDQP